MHGRDPPQGPFRFDIGSRGFPRRRRTFGSERKRTSAFPPDKSDVRTNLPAGEARLATWAAPGTYPTVFGGASLSFSWCRTNTCGPDEPNPILPSRSVLQLRLRPKTVHAVLRLCFAVLEYRCFLRSRSRVTRGQRYFLPDRTDRNAPRSVLAFVSDRTRRDPGWVRGDRQLAIFHLPQRQARGPLPLVAGPVLCVLRRNLSRSIGSFGPVLFCLHAPVLPVRFSYCSGQATNVKGG
eukprot:scaffold139_cov325-Pavlova_lutheri.AAC.61